MKALTRSLISVLISLLINQHAFSQVNIPFSDCFESGDLTFGGWVITGNAQISTTTPYEGSYCVQGNDTYSITKTMVPITTDKVLVEYAVKASQTGSNCDIFRVKDAMGHVASEVFLRWSGYLCAYNGGGDNQLVELLPYIADTWCQVKVVLDMVHHTYDVYIDNQLLADNFAFYDSNFGLPETFYWGSTESWGTGWLDCIQITGENTPPPPGNIPFSDCFESGNLTSG
ncbi:MAG: hypothetical protein NTU44_16050, partial [Bacteroidetes bacterium]|nr:hypothetical protein [Bacteroidota bacterium]